MCYVAALIYSREESTGRETDYRGRPRRRWLDYIKDWTGRPLAECRPTGYSYGQRRGSVENDGGRSMVLDPQK